MKTRIVYPSMWLDENFAKVSVEAKLLFCYLISNQFLGLSRYTRINDRQMMFDTGLDGNQLATAKEDLQNLGWIYFAKDWVFHYHNCAYVDYNGRDRVKEARAAEIDNVPREIKQVLKGLITHRKQNINTKPKTINHKPKTLNPKSETITPNGSNKDSIPSTSAVTEEPPAIGSFKEKPVLVGDDDVPETLGGTV